MLQWLASMWAQFWGALVNLASALVQLLADVLVLLVNLLVDLLLTLLTLAGMIFPEVPALPFVVESPAWDVLEVANYFFPVSEFFQMLLFLGGLYAIRGLILGARFIRGGG